MVGCLQWAMQVHHRITRKDGGRHGQAKVQSDRLSDLLDVCWFCHFCVHYEVTQAYEAGWLLHEWQNPAQEWVTYRGEVMYLTDDGAVLDYETAGA